MVMIYRCSTFSSSAVRQLSLDGLNVGLSGSPGDLSCRRVGNERDLPFILLCRRKELRALTASVAGFGRFSQRRGC